MEKQETAAAGQLLFKQGPALGWLQHPDRPRLCTRGTTPRGCSCALTPGLLPKPSPGKTEVFADFKSAESAAGGGGRSA